MWRFEAAMLVFLLSASLDAAAQSEGDAPNRGLLIWSAFTCATYAELSGDEDEQQRLFDIGYAVGRTFLVSIEDETISEAELERAPVGVRFMLGGPSVDFIIGRIFENAMRDAFDSVVKEDGRGLPILDPSAWADEELRVVRAENKYRGSNCELIG